MCPYEYKLGVQRKIAHPDMSIIRCASELTNMIWLAQIMIRGSYHLAFLMVATRLTYILLYQSIATLRRSCKSSTPKQQRINHTTF